MLSILYILSYNIEALLTAAYTGSSCYFLLKLQCSYHIIITSSPFVIISYLVKMPKPNRCRAASPPLDIPCMVVFPSGFIRTSFMSSLYQAWLKIWVTSSPTRTNIRVNPVHTKCFSWKYFSARPMSVRMSTTYKNSPAMVNNHRSLVYWMSDILPSVERLKRRFHFVMKVDMWLLFEGSKEKLRWTVLCWTPAIQVPLWSIYKSITIVKIRCIFTTI